MRPPTASLYKPGGAEARHLSLIIKQRPLDAGGEVAMKRNRTGKAKKNRCRSLDMSVENGYGLKDVKEQLQCDS